MRLALRASLLAVASMCGVACAPAPKSPEASLDPNGRPPLLEELRTHPQALVNEVATARGMTVKRAVPIAIDDEPAFAAAWNTKVAAETWPPMPSTTAGFALAFGLPTKGARRRVEEGRGEGRAERQAR